MELKVNAVHFDATEKLHEFREKKAAKLQKNCELLSLVLLFLVSLLTLPTHKSTIRQRVLKFGKIQMVQSTSLLVELVQVEQYPVSANILRRRILISR